ncbi:uncharacterized protein PV06_06477 [Exophiala oligosperma]|uniref:Arsenite methyltransferase n=1 Tax=Exophiala oligosperma TaxID=215243 RepID=A0A0D2DJ49_9EURO|nr:uncharacterized protein PV06_06477 [Exophiala oligosperma]KIW42988.1 hypothetical protein PV06_06477 [Exophiala oligosperma]
MAACIISNCVVNLVSEQEKQLVFNEMFLLLKPRGRVAINDILLKRELPSELKTNMALYVGCIAGASLVKDYEKYVGNAGFREVNAVEEKRVTFAATSRALVATGETRQLVMALICRRWTADKLISIKGLYTLSKHDPDSFWDTALFSLGGKVVLVVTGLEGDFIGFPYLPTALLFELLTFQNENDHRNS